MSIEMTKLLNMNRTDLAKKWAEVFGHPAPNKSREDLLRQTLGWHLQAYNQGGISRVDQKRMRGADTKTLAAGSRLIRVWQGETHQVMVLDSGFSYAGRHWKSLSAIARTITGTAWSGPVFFGIKK